MGHVARDYSQIVRALERSRLGTRLLPLARKARQLVDPKLHESISRTSVVKRAFHSPFSNNFVEVFVPIANDREQILKGMHSITAPLNDADGALLSYLMDYCERRRELVTDAMFEEVVYWSVQRKKGRFLGGVEHAEKVLEGFSTQLGESMVTLIEKENASLLDAFCQIPDELKRVFRINVFLAPPAVFELVKRIATRTELPLGRLEVAHVSLRTPSPQPFPSLILYAPATTEEGRKKWLAQWMTFLERELPAESLGEANPEYSDVCRQGCSVTEGFRLYKRYLRILGRLDAVYDARRGYAYAL